MADVKPSEDDIKAIFRKLQSIPTNKICFDCQAKSPTWATVTYGVFICIDCSAVHRSLGVHLTFVRSIQLDTNWTWMQLRQMQLGGNANASVFFRQHNCVTTDAQQKYTSRAAQLYRDKLLLMAQNAMKLHGTELHLEGAQDKPEETQKEVDFFEEHSSFPSFQTNSQSFDVSVAKPINLTASESLAALGGKGPSVDLTAQHQSADRKSIIGGRKPAAKKGGLGGKKTGLGAQRVHTNFADVEREAELTDQRKEERRMEEKKVVTAEEKEEQIVSMRLAYQDLSLEQQKQEEKIKKSDPKKAQQMERLGMGFAVKSGFSHSALSDMQTIEQESPIKKSSSSSKYDNDDNDDFFDDFHSFTLDDLRAMNRSQKYQESGLSSADKYRLRSNNFDEAPSMQSGSQKSSGILESGDRKSYGREEKTSGFPSSKSWHDDRSHNSKTRHSTAPSSTGGDAQKKFGNAKAISSDQYFGQNDDNNYERKANLSRFEGSSSISSSDYFQDGSSNSSRQYGQGITSSISAPDLDEVRESVRQGVTKVAGRISSLANGVINSIQDRYGY